MTTVDRSDPGPVELEPAGQAEAVLHIQNTILVRIARREDVQDTLDLLCSLIEELVPDAVCSVMQSHEFGSELNVSAAPHVPPELACKLNGLVPGPLAGSCGTAYYLSLIHI